DHTGAFSGQSIETGWTQGTRTPRVQTIHLSRGRSHETTGADTSGVMYQGVPEPLVVTHRWLSCRDARPRSATWMCPPGDPRGLSSRRHRRELSDSPAIGCVNELTRAACSRWKVPGRALMRDNWTRELAAMAPSAALLFQEAIEVHMMGPCR